MARLDLTDLVGEWINTNSATRGIRRAVIEAAEDRVKLRVFGTGTPTPEDWGEVTCLPCAARIGAQNAVAFSARFELGNLAVDLSVNGAKGILIFAACQQLTSTDGVDAWFTREFFYRR